MDNVEAVNEVFYFIHNTDFEKDETGSYYPKVILEANWPCNRDHIKNIWLRSIQNNDGNTAQALIDFYADVDSKHRRVMTEWVLENYHSGIRI